MRSVRFTAGLLYHVARWLAVVVSIIAVYAVIVVLVHLIHPSTSLPIRVVGDGSFEIFLPFTRTVFLLGDYTTSFLVSNLLTFAFYGLFLWLLSDIFKEFRRPKIFTRKGVHKLSFFYIINLVVPFVFLGLLFIFGDEVSDIVRIILLHLVIGVFAFFMAAIFKHGVLLQEEQDLTI